MALADAGCLLTLVGAQKHNEQKLVHTLDRLELTFVNRSTAFSTGPQHRISVSLLKQSSDAGLHAQSTLFDHVCQIDCEDASITTPHTDNTVKGPGHTSDATVLQHGVATDLIAFELNNQLGWQ